MSLRVQVKKVKFDKKDMYLVCDMKSSDVFHSITGQSILKAIGSMKNNNIDERNLFYLIASCLRESPHGEPVGKELCKEYNPLAVVAELGEELTNVLIGSLPKAKGKKHQAR